MPEPEVQRTSSRHLVGWGRTVELVFRRHPESPGDYVNLTVAEAHQLQRKLVEHLDALRRENLEAPHE